MSAALHKSLKLDVLDFFEDSAFISIGSAEPGYRLAHILNTRFDLNLAREIDIDICLVKKKTGTTYFDTFLYDEPFNGSKHTLYKLKSQRETLLPELKVADYLWMIQHNLSAQHAEEYIAHLKKLREVSFAQIVGVGEFTHLENLVT